MARYFRCALLILPMAGVWMQADEPVTVIENSFLRAELVSISSSEEGAFNTVFSIHNTTDDVQFVAVQHEWRGIKAALAGSSGQTLEARSVTGLEVIDHHDGETSDLANFTALDPGSRAVVVVAFRDGRELRQAEKYSFAIDLFHLDEDVLTRFSLGFSGISASSGPGE